MIRITIDNTMTPDAIGQTIARLYAWDGQMIVDAFLEALTDANYHGLREKLETIVQTELKAYEEN